MTGPADVPQLLAAMVSIGLSIAFSMPDMLYRPDPAAPPLKRVALVLGLSLPKSSSASLALIYSLQAIGLAALIDSGLLTFAWAPVLDVPLQAAGLVLLLEYIVRVNRMERAGLRALVLRLAQVLALAHVALAYAAGEVAADLRSARVAADLSVPLLLLAAAGVGAMTAVAVAIRHVDEPERVRMKAVALALPLFACGLVMSGEDAAALVIGANLVLLAGAIHHLLAESERGQFLGQFLAPQVATLVRRQGLDAVMSHRRLDVSVVCCDLRGYTALTERAGAGPVLELLDDYYDAVGQAVAQAGGTVKDQAGDGVLILIGAPLPVADHAARALALARRLRGAGAALRARWAPRGLAPGLGIGVASGPVAAGVIGRRTRLEYTAVGPPVNLAARLCAQAGDGEILADAGTIALAGAAAGPHESRPPMNLKGISQPVPVSALGEGALP